MTEKNIGQHDAAAPQPGDANLEQLVDQYAQMFATGVRTPVLKRPDDYGMDYEEVSFPSKDGVPLEGWLIPGDSDRLLIINHPMTCNRYGFPGHLAPYDQMFGGFEVDFLPDLMAQLHRDFLIDADGDGREIFEALGAQDKELYWIEDSNQRFYAYNHFGQHPEKLIGFFDEKMA